jgi:hypothetical protein
MANENVEIRQDPTGVKYLAAGEAKALKDFKTGEQKVDSAGHAEFSQPVLKIDRGRGAVILVKVSGEPKGIVDGVTLTVTDLVATYWSNEKGHGLSWRSSSISLATIAVAKA